MYRYKKIKLPDGTTIDEHRLIWGKIHGPIEGGICIHHINNNGRDNRIENLTSISRPSHVRLHQQGRPSPWNRKPITHGATGYWRGCRCEICRVEQNKRVYAWRSKGKNLINMSPATI